MRKRMRTILKMMRMRRMKMKRIQRRMRMNELTKHYQNERKIT
jgi:hypothetical protein